MSKQRNKRVEQEIAEILERVDSAESNEPSPHSFRRYRPSRGKLQVGNGESATRRIPSGIAWLVGIFGFALLAILVSDWSRTLAIIFGIASILVLFSPLVFWSRPSPMQSGPKEWRGRVVTLPPRQDGLLGKVRYKIWEFRNRGR